MNWHDPTPQPSQPRTAMHLATDYIAGAAALALIVAFGVARRLLWRLLGRR